MKEQSWQFTLRSLFILTTLVAAAIAIVANYPLIASVLLLFAGPFVIARAMVLVLTHWPRQARWAMAVLGAGYSFVSAYLCLRAFQFSEIGWRMLLALGLLTSFGILCYWVAWSIPSKPTTASHSDDAPATTKPHS